MQDVQETQAVVVDIVDDLIQDWGLDLSEPLGGGTHLVKDLNFASVDLIQLCVAVEEHYERTLNFRDLLMVDGSYIEDLSLGEMSEFVAKRLQENDQ